MREGKRNIFIIKLMISNLFLANWSADNETYETPNINLAKIFSTYRDAQNVAVNFVDAVIFSAVVSIEIEGQCPTENQSAQDKLYVIRLFVDGKNKPSYFADWEGDPGRTCLLSIARQFRTKESARNKLKKIIKKYGNRDYSKAQIVEIGVLEDSKNDEN